VSNAKSLASRVQGLLYWSTTPVRIHRAACAATVPYAAMDAVIEVSASKAGRLWTAIKQRDDEGGYRTTLNWSLYHRQGRNLGSTSQLCDTTHAECSGREGQAPSGRHQVAAMTRFAAAHLVEPTGSITRMQSKKSRSPGLRTEAQGLHRHGHHQQS